MNIQHEEMTHLQDEDIVQLLDAEVGDPPRAQWQDHLSGCLPCAERLSEMRQASEWLHEHLPSLDAGIQVDELARARAIAAARRHSAAPAAPPRQSFAWARAAAAAGIVFLAGMTVEPVRAWVFDGFGRLVDTEEAAPAPTIAAPRADAGAVVGFQPTEAIFRIDFITAQAAGRLTIDVVAGTDAQAQVFGAGAEDLSVLPSALLVENAPESTSDYAVALPAGIVRQVQVTVAGEVIFQSSVSEAVEPVVVDLAGARIR